MLRWLKLFKWNGARPKSPIVRKRGKIDLLLEQLEDRTVPTISVTVQSGQMWTEAINMGTRQVATFTDTTMGGSHQATIDWGDGSTTSTGTISGGPSSYLVQGNHIYDEEGSHTLSVTVTGNSSSGSDSKAMTVNDAMLTAQFGGALAPGPSFSNVTLATFTDMDPNGTLSDYSATVNWGDNTGAQSATVVTGSGSGFAVKGSHSYNSLGTFSVSVSIQDGTGSTANVSTSATVAQASTTTTLSSSVNASVYGQPVTFTATVAAVSPGTGTPTGTVTFKDGTSNIGTGTLSAGSATYTTSALSVANHSITAVYGGVTTFATSTSAVLTQTVNKDTTNTSLASSFNPSTIGSSVTFTATSSAASPGSGNPTGTVTFKDGTSTTLGTGTLSGGTATFSSSSLALGTHSAITAIYAGDGNFITSTSASLSQQVNNPVPTLAGIGPASVTEGGAAFTLTVTGTNFLATSVVDEDGSALATTYVSSTSLTAAVPASLLLEEGSPTITVVNPGPGGGTSAGIVLHINDAPLTAGAFTPPAGATAGQALSNVQLLHFTDADSNPSVGD